MKAKDKKIQGIVDELLTNSLSAGSTDVNISVIKDSEKTTIKVVDNGKGMDGETLNYVRWMLNQPHRYDLEDYYGGLAGLSSTRSGSGLNLIGLTVDDAIVESSPKGTSIIVIRKDIK